MSIMGEAIAEMVMGFIELIASLFSRDDDKK